MADVLDWNYNSNTGAVMQLPSPASAIMRSTGTGWHGPFKTKEEALAFYENGKASNPGWKAPAGFPDQIGNAITSAQERTAGVAKEIVGGLDLASWFIRIGEVLLGIVLIGVGIAKLTGTTNAISKLAKVAIPG